MDVVLVRMGAVEKAVEDVTAVMDNYLWRVEGIARAGVVGLFGDEEVAEVLGGMAYYMHIVVHAVDVVDGGDESW